MESMQIDAQRIRRGELVTSARLNGWIFNTGWKPYMTVSDSRKRYVSPGQRNAFKASKPMQMGIHHAFSDPLYYIVGTASEEGKSSYKYRLSSECDYGAWRLFVFIVYLVTIINVTFPGSQNPAFLWWSFSGGSIKLVLQWLVLFSLKWTNGIGVPSRNLKLWLEVCHHTEACLFIYTQQHLALLALQCTIDCEKRSLFWAAAPKP